MMLMSQSLAKCILSYGVGVHQDGIKEYITAEAILGNKPKSCLRKRIKGSFVFGRDLPSKVGILAMYGGYKAEVFVNVQDLLHRYTRATNKC